MNTTGKIFGHYKTLLLFQSSKNSQWEIPRGSAEMRTSRRENGRPKEGEFEGSAVLAGVEGSFLSTLSSLMLSTHAVYQSVIQRDLISETTKTNSTPKR